MFYRTAESVSPKHPDKLCDRISDAILDAYLAKDPEARVAAETCGGHDVVFVTGEITSTAEVDIPAIVKKIAGENLEVHTKIVKQSPEIAQGVDTGGAGDQGIMVGYACDDTPELLPREVVLARRLNQFIYQKHPYDGKTQITLAPNGEVESIVVSFQNVSSKILKQLVEEFIKKYQLTGKLELHLNPAGDWNQGGFDADTGLTGRKLIVDNYGPGVAIGGGCYSGKDPSKVDRSAAYATRWVAKNVVASGLAERCEVQVAYAIGRAHPVGFYLDTFGTGKVPNEQIVDAVNTTFDLRPASIIADLDLLRPIYRQFSTLGHFGRTEADATWERTDRAEALARAVKG